MIGRAPMMLPPQYVSQPMPGYPGQQPAPPRSPQQWVPPRAQAVQQPQAKPQAAPQVAGQQPVQPIIARGKPYDEPQPPNTTVKATPIVLPSPQALGVVPSAPVVAKVDWNTTHERLQRLGGTGFQSLKLPDGRYRVGFILQASRTDEVHRVEATSDSEAEAVAAALRQAEDWASAMRGRP
jgi:hypothetical protein